MARIKLGFIRRALIVFLAVVLVLPGFLGFNLNSPKIAAGDGSSPDTPIIITTPAELDNIRNGLNRHYKLGNDIDLIAYITSRTDWGTSGWEPIGTQHNPFTGSLDGDGYAVIGLWINRSTTNNAGLFGYTQNASFKNLGVEISSGGIIGGVYVGGLVGRQVANGGDASIINCYVTGDVTATGMDSLAGGLVGMQNGLSSSVNSITNCYATGDVTATYHAGGLVGVQSSNNSGSNSIANCYASGNVTATYYAGGLIGFQSVWGSGSNSTVACFYDYSINSINGIGTLAPGTGSNDVTGKTTAEMKAIETFTTELTGAGKTPWDFTGSAGNPPVWYIIEGEDYPRLTKGNGHPKQPLHYLYT